MPTILLERGRVYTYVNCLPIFQPKNTKKTQKKENGECLSVTFYNNKCCVVFGVLDDDRR